MHANKKEPPRAPMGDFVRSVRISKISSTNRVAAIAQIWCSIFIALSALAITMLRHQQHSRLDPESCANPHFNNNGWVGPASRGTARAMTHPGGFLNSPSSCTQTFIEPVFCLGSLCIWRANRCPRLIFSRTPVPGVPFVGDHRAQCADALRGSARGHARSRARGPKRRCRGERGGGGWQWQEEDHQVGRPGGAHLAGVGRVSRGRPRNRPVRATLPRTR